MRSFAMLRADFHEGVEGAECDMQPQPLMEKAGNFAIRPPFAPKFADQFVVGLQFGARRLGRKTGQLSRTSLTLCICGGKKKSHGYPRRRLRPHSADDHWQVVGELFE